MVIVMGTTTIDRLAIDARKKGANYYQVFIFLDLRCSRIYAYFI